MGKGLLDPKESEKVRHLEMTVKELREAKDELIRMSNDAEQRELYEMRAKILKDKNSALSKAKEEGIKEGIYTIARALLDVLDDEMIILKTGLSKEEVTRLRIE
ncbi:MAG: hypothetical protein ACRCWY_12380 [Cellulosilyticaceae bacterium]